MTYYQQCIIDFPNIFVYTIGTPSEKRSLENYAGPAAGLRKQGFCKQVVRKLLENPFPFVCIIFLGHNGSLMICHHNSMDITAQAGQAYNSYCGAGYLPLKHPVLAASKDMMVNLMDQRFVLE